MENQEGQLLTRESVKEVDIAQLGLPAYFILDGEDTADPEEVTTPGGYSSYHLCPVLRSSELDYDHLVSLRAQYLDILNNRNSLAGVNYKELMRTIVNSSNETNTNEGGFDRINEEFIQPTEIDLLASDMYVTDDDSTQYQQYGAYWNYIKGGTMYVFFIPPEHSLVLYNRDMTKRCRIDKQKIYNLSTGVDLANKRPAWINSEPPMIYVLIKSTNPNLNLSDLHDLAEQAHTSQSEAVLQKSDIRRMQSQPALINDEGTVIDTRTNQEFNSKLLNIRDTADYVPEDFKDLEVNGEVDQLDQHGYFVAHTLYGDIDMFNNERLQ